MTKLDFLMVRALRFLIPKQIHPQNGYWSISHWYFYLSPRALRPSKHTGGTPAPMCFFVIFFGKNHVRLDFLLGSRCSCCFGMLLVDYSRKLQARTVINCALLWSFLLLVLRSLEINQVEFEKGPFEGMLPWFLLSMNLMNFGYCTLAVARAYTKGKEPAVYYFSGVMLVLGNGIFLTSLFESKLFESLTWWQVIGFTVTWFIFSCVSTAPTKKPFWTPPTSGGWFPRKKKKHPSLPNSSPLKSCKGPDRLPVPPFLQGCCSGIPALVFGSAHWKQNTHID